MNNLLPSRLSYCEKFDLKGAHTLRTTVFLSGSPLSSFDILRSFIYIYDLPLPPPPPIIIGSTHGRLASQNELKKKSPTLKDLDFIEKHPGGIRVPKDTYEKLASTLRRDCMVRLARSALE